MRVVLLEVVDALSDICCGEVLVILLTPLHLWRGDHASRRSIKQELGQFRSLKPSVISLDCLDHIGRRTFDGKLIGPAPDAFAACRVLERLAVAVHFRFGQWAHNAAGNGAVFVPLWGCTIVYLALPCSTADTSSS